MAKNYLTNGAVIASGTEVTNFIQQISTPEGVYDVAVKQGITFFNGQADASGLHWDGSAPFEVVIPSVTDIVQDPVRMVGTVGASGELPEGLSPAKGDLVYMTADCVFQSVICEAGDMAIYDGQSWHVIQGENQVTITGGTVDASGNHAVAIGGNPVNVLNVEGKNLSLAIDYADVRNKVGVVKNNQAVELSVENASVSVLPKYIALSQEQGTSKDISVPVSISLPTALASGAVTIDPVLQATDFSFSAGSQPTAVKNDSTISVNASHNMTIGKEYSTDGNDGAYVTNVVAIKSVSFTAGTESSNVLGYVSGLVDASGKTFVSGIHVFDSVNETGSADFEVPGAISAPAAANTFVSGLSAEAAEGDVLSSISVGAVTIGAGEAVLTGLTSGDSVVTGVEFGTAVKDTSAAWFLSGLGEESTSGDVLTGISIGTTSFISDNSSSFAGSAVVNASVNNHVLSFNTGSFMTPVALSKTADTFTFKSFNTAGVSLSGFTKTSSTFTTGDISQASTSVSYKSVLTKAVELTTGAAVGYKLDLDVEHAYDVAREYKNFQYEAATMSKNSPKLENTNITATIAANTVVVDLSAGTLPEFSVGTATGSISGTVGTALTTTDASWLGVNPSLATIDIAGGYTLEVVASDAAGAVEVANASTYGVDNGTVSIAADTFLTDVTVNGNATPQSNG